MYDFFRSDLHQWLILVGIIVSIPAGLGLLIVLTASIIDVVLRITTRREYRFLYLPVPFPPVNERVIVELQQLREQVEEQVNDINREVCLKYLEAIEEVLTTRSREALLQLLALRVVLQREVRDQRSRSN